MNESPIKTQAPDLEYPFDENRDISPTVWLSAMLAFCVGVAAQAWDPWNAEGLTFRSSILIAAIGAFVLSRFSVSGNKGWMIGLLMSTVVISAVTSFSVFVS